jgi:N-acyl homoserine lactone hydrolase
MNIKPYKVKKSPSKGWGKIFTNSRPVKLRSFKTGTVDIQLRGTLNPTHPNAVNIKNEIIEVPIMVHWVHHEEFGDYLLDTGLDASYSNDELGGITEPLAEKFIQKKDENIGFYVEKNDIKVNMVFLSHLHPDHIAGIRDLPKNIPYIVGKGELEQYKPELYGDFLKSVETFYELEFSELDIISPLGRCADLLGDGSIWAFWTPGHTKGHTSYIINGADEPILLTMDAAFIQENLKYKVAPLDYTWDSSLAQKSLDKIIEFIDQFKIRVICGHELN